MGFESKPLETLAHEKSGPGDSTVMLRRGDEAITVELDEAGNVADVTYYQHAPDGSQVIIHRDQDGYKAIVADPGERDLRFYRVGPGGEHASYHERLIAGETGELAERGIDPGREQADLALIQSACMLFDQAQERPEGFEKVGIFEAQS